MVEHSYKSNKVFNIVVYFIILCFSITCIYPFIYAIAVSLNDPADSIKGGIYFFPRVFSIISYQTIFSANYIVNSYIISIFRTLTGIFLSIVVNSMFAYVLSRRNEKIRLIKFLNYVVVIPMYFSGGMLPTYLVFKSYGLVNNIWVYVLPAVVGSFSIILIRAFISELPKEMEEAAFIDGAGHWLFFTRIIIPLSMPVLAVTMLNTGVHHWNDWVTGVIFVSKENLNPTATLLYKVLSQATASQEMMLKIPEVFLGKASITPESIRMSMLVTLTVPILFIYPFFQRYFEQGMMIGAVKG